MSSDPIGDPTTDELMRDLVRLAVRDGRYTPECGGYPATVHLSLYTLQQMKCAPDNLEFPAEPISDFSESNPKLHRLYVYWAQDHMKMIGEFLDRCAEYSNVHMHMLAGAITEHRAMLIRTNAAYREACWRLQSGDLLPNRDVQLEGEAAIEAAFTAQA